MADEAAVHEQSLAGDVTGGIGEQEGDRAGQVARSLGPVECPVARLYSSRRSAGMNSAASPLGQSRCHGVDGDDQCGNRNYLSSPLRSVWAMASGAKAHPGRRTSAVVLTTVSTTAGSAVCDSRSVAGRGQCLVQPGAGVAWCR